MKKIYILIISVIFLLPVAKAQIFTDNFESYTVGEQLTVQAGLPWTTWSNAPGGAEDPYVSNQQAFSGTNSVKIADVNDCVLLLGDKTSSRYKLSFYIYIPAGKLGYYNVLQDFDGSNSMWGLQMFFNAEGSGSIDANGESTATFTYNYNEWILVENYFDLDNDWAEVFIDGNYLFGWQWTLGTFGTPGPLQLSAANFYAWDGSKSNRGIPEYFVDNIKYEEMPLGQAPSNLQSSVNQSTVNLNWEAPSNSSPNSYYIFRNSQLVGFSTNAFYEETLDLPGNYTYKVKAFYTEKGLSQASNQVNVEIEGGISRTNVLLEIGTGTWCYYCPGAAMGADEMAAAGYDISIIEYHNGDEFTTLQSDARNDYYEIPGFPTSFFDGINKFVGGSNTESLFDIYLSYYNERIAVKSVFDLKMDVQMNESRDKSYEILLNTEQLWDYSGSDLRLHVVLTESHIPADWFSMTEVNFVCREMYPDENGTKLSLGNLGDTEELNYTIYLPDSLNTSNCSIVAFIQDNDTKEVLNSTYFDLAKIGIVENGNQNFRVYPNPTSGKVSIDSEVAMKRVSIFNIGGQKVYEIALDYKQFNLNIDFLKSGMYMLVIETEQSSRAEKLFVQ